jgi:hypothetical protein
VADKLSQVDPSRGSLFNNVSEAFLWYFNQALPRSFTLWFIKPSLGWDLYSTTVLIIFILSTFFSILIIFKKFFLFKRILFTGFYNLFSYSVLVVTYAPVIISNFRLEVYRSSLVLSAYIFSIIAIQVWMILFRYNEVNKKIISLVLIFSLSISFICYQLMHNQIVRPKFYEYTKLRSIISMIDPNSVMSGLPMHLIIPRQLEPWNTDEVGRISSEFTDEIDIMMSVIRSNSNLRPVPVSYSYSDPDITLNNRIIIDLRDINSPLTPNTVIWPKLINNQPCIASDHSVNRGIHLCGRAFDGKFGPDDFWEAFLAPNMPVSLELSLENPRVISKYQFFAGQLFNRMPVRWDLNVSNDRIQWKIIDSRIIDRYSWNDNLFQEFKLTKVPAYKYYKFIFYQAFSDDILRIYEIKFYGADNSVVQLKTN